MSQMERGAIKRFHTGLLLRAPWPNSSGLYEASVIRTPIIRFQIRHVSSLLTPPQLTSKQNWPSDKGEVVSFPLNLKVDQGLKVHLVSLFEVAWTSHVLPELRKRELGQEDIFAVQVVYRVGQQPLVRLNKEVRGTFGTVERRQWCSPEDRLLLRLKVGVAPPCATTQVIDMELADDERDRYGHFTCFRLDSYWNGLIDLVGLLPKTTQDVISAWDYSALCQNIILSVYGDDSAKDELLHQLNVDMFSLPEPLKEEVPKLIYSSIYRVYDEAPVRRMTSIINHRIMQELWKEKESLHWDYFLEFPDRLSVSPEEANDLKQAMERYFTVAGLGSKEQEILKLNAILACRGDKWTRPEKAKYLKMSVKSYEKYLRHLRMSLQMDISKQIAEGYKRLLGEILKGG